MCLASIADALGHPKIAKLASNDNSTTKCYVIGRIYFFNIISTQFGIH